MFTYIIYNNNFGITKEFPIPLFIGMTFVHEREQYSVCSININASGTPEAVVSLID